MKRKLFICGGHITPAIAFIDEIKNDHSVEPVFVGRKTAAEGEQHNSAEYELIKQKHIRFLPITAGRLQRSLTARSIPSMFKIPVGFIQAMRLCMTERPALVISFGGYVALPVAVSAWLLGIPVITHEQTLTAGLSNRIIAWVARRVCVSFEDTLRHFPAEKAVFTGLPMRMEIFEDHPKAAFDANIKKFPLIYITGGSLGAKSLNDCLFSVIPALVPTYTVIHQTGISSFQQADKVRKSLPDATRNRYIIEPYISVTRIPWIFRHARIVIGRSGANTVFELAALGKVAILIPLPWSAGNEQLLQARWLSTNGGAMTLIQSSLTPDLIQTAITSIQHKYSSYAKRAQEFSTHIPRDGAKRFAAEVRAVLQSYP